jgi:hypothetical protein
MIRIAVAFATLSAVLLTIGGAVASARAQYRRPLSPAVREFF